MLKNDTVSNKIVHFQGQSFTHAHLPVLFNLATMVFHLVSMLFHLVTCYFTWLCSIPLSPCDINLIAIFPIHF